MALSSRRSARRSITMAAVGLLTVGFVASCGANTSPSVTANMTPSVPANTSSSVPSVAAPTTTQPASGEVRLGCATYCQNMGGYGGVGHAPKPPAVTIVSTGTVTADADGYVPVTLTCDLPVQCSGGLLLCLTDPAIYSDPAVGGGGMSTTCGRSDLLLDVGATRTFGAALPAPAFAWLRSNSPATLKVYAASGQSQVSPGEYESLIIAVLMVAAPG